ncbi:MAG: dethiobiotin synthase [Chlamydiota bacterium]|nr:dethiobiotin synthase [Chlamydiota bacterium]
MSKVLFVTGTDTGIGKTYVTALLAATLTKTYKLRVGVMKPFASGSMNDTVMLMKYSNVNSLKDEVTPFFTQIPLAPYAALKRCPTLRIPFHKIDRCFKKLQSSCDLLLIEGLGGISVPLTRSISLGQWVSSYKWPTIIVTHPWLGTLNHTLLTVSYLKKLHIPIEGIIFNRPKRKIISSVEKSNIMILSELSKTSVIGNIPYKKKIACHHTYFDKHWLSMWRR